MVSFSLDKTPSPFVKHTCSMSASGKLMCRLAAPMDRNPTLAARAAGSSGAACALLLMVSLLEQNTACMAVTDRIIKSSSFRNKSRRSEPSFPFLFYHENLNSSLCRYPGGLIWGANTVLALSRTGLSEAKFSLLF